MRPDTKRTPYWLQNTNARFVYMVPMVSKHGRPGFTQRGYIEAKDFYVKALRDARNATAWVAQVDGKITKHASREEAQQRVEDAWRAIDAEARLETE